MKDYTTYVGIDVHTRSITCKGVNITTGEPFEKTFKNCPTDEDIAKWMLSLPQPLYCAYESGCTGFHLAKHLRKRGIDCDIIAISTLRSSTKEKESKSDEVDAKKILGEITNLCKNYSVVYIPTDEQLARQELVRSRYNAAKDLRKSKQRLVSFLHKHGFVFNEKTVKGNVRKRWTRYYYKWLDEIQFSQTYLNDAFLYYIDCIKENEQRLKRIDKTIKEEAAEEKDVKPFVQALCCIKGLDTISAFTIVAELGCFNRFSKGRQISSYAGLIPKNHSSGLKDKQGSITKAGNKFIRQTLIESLGLICIWKARKKDSPHIRKVSTTIAQLTDRANTRVIERYDKLKSSNKNYNVIKVACANELMKRIWIVGCTIEEEMRAK